MADLLSMAAKLFLAALLGGIVGLERESKKRAAGLRTHLLVSLGSALVMITSEYVMFHYQGVANVDPTRLGAQVISGIGFLGAGLILVTSKNKVKGLTTAAGLWASACIGLALGIGFYAGALIAGTLVFVVLALLPRLEVYFYNRSRVMELFVEVDCMNNMREFLSSIRSQNMTIIETHINKSDAIVSEGYSLNLSIRIPKKLNHIEVIELLSSFPGVFLVEELE